MLGLLARGQWEWNARRSRTVSAATSSRGVEARRGGPSPGSENRLSTP